MRYPLWRVALVVLAVLAGVVPAGAQVGFDRPGRDFASFAIRSGDPAACAQRCEQDARCRAWNFAYPATAGAPAMCWLKSEVAPRVENACCISGVRGAGIVEPRRGAVEFAIDRVGGDYRIIDTVADPTGKICADLCEADSRCRAFTYERPGYSGPARCYLKERLTPPRRAPCCVSGVVR